MSNCYSNSATMQNSFNNSYSKLRVTAKSWGEITDEPSPKAILALPNENTSSLQKFNEDSSQFVTSDIRLTDSLDTVRLYHYSHCDENSTDDVKACRGIIRDGNKIVCKTFGWTPEVEGTLENIHKYTHSLSTCKFYDAEEGATIRLWEHNGVWNLSTHRKIDAYHSRWGNPKSKSFGTMFHQSIQYECKYGGMKNKFFKEDEIIPLDLFKRYTDSLDKNKVYTFLVRNDNENRIVCDQEDVPKSYFIGAFDKVTSFLVEGGNDTGFEYPNEHFFSTPEDIFSFVQNVDYRKKQGVIVYLPNQKQVKFMNTKYIELFEGRGNEPSIQFRYLQVRGDSDKVSILYTLYPDYIPIFEKYENILNDVATKIHKSYLQRFIRKEFVSLPQQEFFVLQACHGYFMSDRIRNKITNLKVLEILNNQPPTSLNRIIKQYTKFIDRE